MLSSYVRWKLYTVENSRRLWIKINYNWRCRILGRLLDLLRVIADRDFTMHLEGLEAHYFTGAWTEIWSRSRHSIGTLLTLKLTLLKSRFDHEWKTKKHSWDTTLHGYVRYDDSYVEGKESFLRTERSGLLFIAFPNFRKKLKIQETELSS